MEQLMSRAELLAMRAGVRDPQVAAHIDALLRDQSAGKRVWKRPYSYTTEFVSATFTAGATVTNNIPIQADADFMILSQTYSADVAGAGQTASSRTYPLAKVLLTNTGSGEQMMSAAIPVPEIFGDGQFPYVLPEPYILPARGNLQVQATNYDAAQAYHMFLTFNGVKMYSAG